MLACNLVGSRVLLHKAGANSLAANHLGEIFEVCAVWTYEGRFCALLANDEASVEVRGGDFKLHSHPRIPE